MNNFVYLNLKPKVISKKILKTTVRYTYYNNHGRYAEIWFKPSKYSKEELDFVDDLFNNLDEGNLAIIKGVLHSKTKSRKYERKL